MDSYVEQFLDTTIAIVKKLNREAIQGLVKSIREIRDRNGRLFILGVGGSAANASHAVGDFRKLVGIEAYAPTDNVAELTARVNDEGWQTVFVEWLKGSRLNERDGLMIFSVGGGDLEKNISPNLVLALKYAQEKGATILGVVGRDGGFTAKVAKVCLIIPPLDSKGITPQTESFHSLIWHLIVTHPDLKTREMKWESQK